MRKIKRTQGESLALGRIPKGCELCIKGQKLVLFATGLCKQRCWYCTISKNRWQKDAAWANERPVRTDDDILDEARLCKAKGAGITGGEPLLRMDRVTHYIKLLKENFSQKFQIHMYTCGYNSHNLEKLYKAGLDELRIHLNKDLVKEALAFDWSVGMEIPVVPQKEKEIKQLILYLDRIGAKFLNMNEMEFSDRNVEPMMKRGLILKKDSPNAVLSSEGTAKKVLAWAEENANLNIHYCTAALKLDYQLKNRMINRANSIKKPFEIVTEDGLLLKGVIFADPKQVENILPRKMFFVNKEKNRIETSPAIAEKLADRFKTAIVKEYPIYKPWDFEFIPLSKRF